MAQIQDTGGVASVSPQTSVGDDYQHIQSSPADFGAAVGQGAQALGQGGMQVHKVWSEIQTDGSINDANSEALDVVKKYTNLKGQSALDAQNDTKMAVDKAYNERRAQLGSADQQLAFDNQSRSFRQRFLDPQIDNHATQQGHEYATTVNSNRTKSGMDLLASLDTSDPDYQAKADDAIHMVIGGAVRNAHLNLGDNAKDEDIEGYVRPYLQAALKTQAQVMAVKDPVGAADFLDKHREQIGIDYPALSSQFRTRANEQAALGIANDAFTTTVNGIQQAPAGAKADTAAVREAVLQQESTNRPNAPDSVNGAVGVGQIIPTTFAQYAKPGEDIRNPADNRAVATRIVDDLSQRFDGDPSRIAVGYFSGPDNVAPPGSPNPWIRDSRDGNGKSVSSYVQDVNHRLGTQGPMLAARAGVYDAVLAKTEGNPQLRQAALKEVQQRYSAAEIADLQDQKARKAQQDATIRGYGDQIRSGSPDMPWRKDPNLTEENVEHLDKLALDTAKEAIDGKPGDWGPGFDSIKQRIAHPDMDGGIRNQEQLLALQASGDLNPQGYHKAAEYLKDINEPHAAEDARTEADFYKAARQIVTLEDPNFPSLKAPDADKKWIAARSALDAAMTKAKADPKGFTTQQLTDPNNPNSLWKVLGEPGGLFLPSQNDKTLAAAQQDRAAAFDTSKIKTWQDAQAAYQGSKISAKQANDLVLAHPEWGIIPMGGPQVPQVTDQQPQRKHIVGDVVIQDGKKYRATKIDKDGRISDADEVQ